MVARANASVFVGEEVCKNKQVINRMQTLTTDIGNFHPRYNFTWLTSFPWLMKLHMRYHMIVAIAVVVLVVVMLFYE